MEIKLIMPYFDSSIRNKTTTIMKANIQNFSNEIDSIVAFAKRINYNIENGIEGLAALWIEDTRKAHVAIMENKPMSISLVKQKIK